MRRRSRAFVRTLPLVLAFGCSFGITALAVTRAVEPVRAMGVAAPAGSLVIGVVPGVALNGTTFVSGTVNVRASATDLAVAGVQFQVNGTNLGSELTSGDCGLDWNTATRSDGTYTVTASAHDLWRFSAPSASMTVTIQNAALQMSSVSTSGLTKSTVTISWTTNQPADTRVSYGIDRTNLVFSQALVTAHTQTLTGLTPGALYHLKAQSANLLGVLVASADVTIRPPLF